MNPFEIISIILFVLLLVFIVYKNRKRIEIQKIAYPVVYMILLKSKVGLDFMDRVAKRAPKFWRALAYISIIIGFAGMIFIVYSFVDMTKIYFQEPDAPASVQLLIPGVNTPFWFAIISLATLIIIHETSHGIFARLYNLKIKSSGLAFLAILVPIIPAAFVEPDEKKMEKKNTKEQLAILSAGSFANIITAFLILFVILGLIITPAINHTSDITIRETQKGLPAEKAGILANSTIEKVNGIGVNDFTSFTETLSDLKPGDTVTITTDTGTYNMIATSQCDPAINITKCDEKQAYLGVIIEPTEKKEFENKYGKWPFLTLLWFKGLFWWMFIIHFSVGLINLFPVFITDGSKMLYISLKRWLNKEIALKTWVLINVFCVILLLINLLFPYLRDLFVKIIGPG